MDLTQQRPWIMPGPERVQLAATGQVDASGRFEIMAITAGLGNGWTFPAEVLQKSLPLWDVLECFVDHGDLFSAGRSVRDLGGLCHSPLWDESAQGIRVQLKTTGPSGPL